MLMRRFIRLQMSKEGNGIQGHCPGEVEGHNPLSIAGYDSLARGGEEEKLKGERKNAHDDASPHPSQLAGVGRAARVALDTPSAIPAKVLLPHRPIPDRDTNDLTRLVECELGRR